MVRLAGCDVRTTALGFGSAALLGRIGDKESRRLLERAYDEGIRYFDTAPAYGYGRAEALIGAFAARKSDVAIATKFGLSFQGRSSPLLKYAANVARPILRNMPNVRGRVGSLARSKTPAVSNFTVDAARESLDASLRKLRRDCIDVFLLHECRKADLANAELLEFLNDAVRRGLIRAFGIGTDPETVAYAANEAPGFDRVLQFANNAASRNLERLNVAREDRTIVTHTPFGGVGKVAADPSESLRYALRSNRRGIVLFSTTREERISANVRVANDLPTDD
jgi:aryl-alcohol dehydrogenase-like predicted oxidoreductase